MMKPPVTSDLACLVAILETDPLFSMRIADAVRAAGAHPVIVRDGATLAAAIDRWPALVLVDLAVADWETPVARAKNLPHTRMIPIAAFGSCVGGDMLCAARAIGCDHVWTRSRFVIQLPALLQATLHPRRSPVGTSPRQSCSVRASSSSTLVNTGHVTRRWKHCGTRKRGRFGIYIRAYFRSGLRSIISRTAIFGAR